ncbi:MAG: site-2 protease family protein, partial [Acidobacteriaceae bacterium]
MEHFILAQLGLSGAESVLRALVFFIITIFVLVSVHEFGHFIAGRIFGMRVPVYSIGMGRRLFGFNRINGFTTGPLDAEAELKLENHTDYRISLLPIGGYAKIEGMIDETQNEALPEEVQPWEFRAKPWWQKSIVISAGVIMNVLLAWGIFSARNLIYGSEGWATTTVGYVRPGSASAALGILPGDRILSINHKQPKTWQDVDAVPMDDFGRDFSMQFERGGKVYSVVYTASSLGSLQNAGLNFGLEPAGLAAPVIDSVFRSQPAAAAGLRSGDTVMAINGIRVVSTNTFVSEISSHPLKPITIEVSRKGVPATLTVTPDAAGKIGVAYVPSQFLGKTVTIRYGLLASMQLGWTDLWTITRLTVVSVAEVIRGTMPVGQALGGPVKIAAYASKSAAGGLD